LVGCLVFLTRFGEISLDRFQLGSLPCGELQLLLNTSRKEASFARRPVIFQRGLVFVSANEQIR
jgi:hypothetical protein